MAKTTKAKTAKTRSYWDQPPTLRTLTKKYRHKRTGVRKPLNFLKAWGDRDHTGRLTPNLCVSMVDEELPVEDAVLAQVDRLRGYGDHKRCPVYDAGGRKSWYLALTQERDLAEELGPIRGLPNGRTLLLFEDDVVALVDHVVRSWLVQWDDEGRAYNDAAEDLENFKRLKGKQKASRTNVARKKR